MYTQLCKSSVAQFSRPELYVPAPDVIPPASPAAAGGAGDVIPVVRHKGGRGNKKILPKDMPVDVGSVSPAVYRDRVAAARFAHEDVLESEAVIGPKKRDRSRFRQRLVGGVDGSLKAHEEVWPLSRCCADVQKRLGFHLAKYLKLFPDNEIRAEVIAVKSEEAMSRIVGWYGTYHVETEALATFPLYNLLPSTNHCSLSQATMSTTMENNTKVTGLFAMACC